MQVKIKSIDSMQRCWDTRYSLEADIDFEDEEAVIRDFGAEKCVGALDESDVFDALGGWEAVQSFYADEIEKMLEQAKCASSQG